MDRATYVILRAVHPSWCTTQLPGEVADLLGCRPEDLASLRKPGRGLAFLDRGPGTLRVVGVHRSADLMAREMARNRVLAVAQLTEKLVFNLPDSVERHLEIQTYPRGEHGARGTDDGLIWFIPLDEYRRYREERRNDERPSISAGRESHVYLAKSTLPKFRPPVDELEGPAALPRPSIRAPRSG